MARHSLGSIVALSSDIATRLFVTVMSVAPMAVLICSGLSRNPCKAPSATALLIARDDASTGDFDVVGVRIDPESRAIRTPRRTAATITAARATTTGVEGKRRGSVSRPLDRAAFGTCGGWGWCA